MAGRLVTSPDFVEDAVGETDFGSDEDADGLADAAG
jgi:hypothetical protein